MWDVFQIFFGRVKLGTGKEILLMIDRLKANFASDGLAKGGVIRMHEIQACEIPLLWGASSAIWS